MLLLLSHYFHTLGQLPGLHLHRVHLFLVFLVHPRCIVQYSLLRSTVLHPLLNVTFRRRRTSLHVGGVLVLCGHVGPDACGFLFGLAYRSVCFVDLGLERFALGKEPFFHVGFVVRSFGFELIDFGS